MKSRDCLLSAGLIAVALVLTSCATTEPVTPRPGLNQTNEGEIVKPLPWSGDGISGPQSQMGTMNLAPAPGYYR